jgi:hypothetical protein
MRIPSYIETYIQDLARTFNSNPTELYQKYGFSENRIPSLVFESAYDSNSGWRVDHKDSNSGEVYFSELVIPAAARTNPAKPVLTMDPIDPPKPPTESISNNIFTLMVENVGLPAGLEASTQVLCIDSNGNIIRVISYTFKTSMVVAVSGEYVASNTSPIIPKPDTVITQQIRWHDRLMTGEVPPITIPTDEIPLPKPRPPIYTTVSSELVKPIIELSKFPYVSTATTILPPRYSLDPYIPPEDSFEATAVEEMLSYTYRRSQFNIYEIGSDRLPEPTTYIMRNNTVNTPLLIKFIFPDFLKIDTVNPITLNPQQSIVIVLSLNIDALRTKFTLKDTSFQEDIKWSIQPLNLKGPVYIKRNLPAVTL